MAHPYSLPTQAQPCSRRGFAYSCVDTQLLSKLSHQTVTLGHLTGQEAHTPGLILPLEDGARKKLTPTLQRGSGIPESWGPELPSRGGSCAGGHALLDLWTPYSGIRGIVREARAVPCKVGDRGIQGRSLACLGLEQSAQVGGQTWGDRA